MKLDPSLERFLDSWDAVIDGLGIDLRLRVHQVLDGAIASDHDRLRQALRAILVLQPEQSLAFDNLFDACFQRVAPRPPRSRHWRRWRLATAALAAVTSLVVASYVLAPPMTVRLRDRLWQPDPRAGDVQQPEVTRTFLVWQNAVIHEWMRYAVLAAGAVALANALVHLRRPRRRAAAEVAPITVTGEQREPDYRSTSPLQPFTRGECDALAAQVGAVRTPGQRDIHLRATVSATARQAGVVQVVFRPERRPIKLLVVLAQPVDELRLAPFMALAAALKERGIVAGIVSGMGLLEPTDVVLVAVHTARVDPAALQRARRLSHVAFVEVRDRSLWSDEVARFPIGIYAPDFDGMSAALKSAVRGEKPPSVTALPVLLRNRLAEISPLAVACALIAPCDLATMDQLRRELFPWIGFCQLQRLLSQPGVIVDRTGIDLEDDVRCAWLGDASNALRSTLLRWQRKRLQRVTAQAGSLAEAVIRRDQAVTTFELALLDHASAPVPDRQLLAPLEELVSQRRDAATRAPLLDRLALLERRIGKLAPARFESERAVQLASELALVDETALAWRARTRTRRRAAAGLIAGIVACLVSFRFFQLEHPDDAPKSVFLMDPESARLMLRKARSTRTLQCPSGSVLRGVVQYDGEPGAALGAVCSDVIDVVRRGGAVVVRFDGERPVAPSGAQRAGRSETCPDGTAVHMIRAPSGPDGDRASVPELSCASIKPDAVTGEIVLTSPLARLGFAGPEAVALACGGREIVNGIVIDAADPDIVVGITCTSVIVDYDKAP